jgi:hypothetical protein
VTWNEIPNENPKVCQSVDSNFKDLDGKEGRVVSETWNGIPKANISFAKVFGTWNEISKGSLLFTKARGQ